MSRGAVATLILRAIVAGKTFEASGVPDTPHNRHMWDSTRRDIERMPPGAIVDIPSDWAEMPDD